MVQICPTAGTGDPLAAKLAVTAVTSFPCLLPNGPASSLLLMLAQALVQQRSELDNWTDPSLTWFTTHLYKESVLVQGGNSQKKGCLLQQQQHRAHAGWDCSCCYGVQFNYPLLWYSKILLTCRSCQTIRCSSLLTELPLVSDPS